ncbi:hypothetical protein K490DRAFT_54955 [Saccharata proteae CBS 121410]|uniref:PHD-type domain-containing protein n=1 Tax=Saccharata proteae CBS 121410 TaxID=1314787 RepID=A0A6A5YCD8_9PEZI|nr:hypothetical protein K490DRAFT_54955 [Saccharata proteae CBS 121410]
MKSATVTQTVMSRDAPNRRQSTRAQRTTSSRPANYYARTFNGRGSTLGGTDNASANNSTPGFFPAITHFTDCITALPKEVTRHLAMLKEVEAKTFGPDEELNLIADAIQRLPSPTRLEAQLAAQNAASTANNSVNGSVAGSVAAGQTPLHQQQGQEQPGDASRPQSKDEQSDAYRRQLFLRFRYGLLAMCSMLDEKNSVLSTANRALTQQLERMNTSFKHMDEEISEEARHGSRTHWAYKDGDEKKKGPANERSRREVASANNLAAAAAAVHEGDIAANRSEARREVMLANKQRRANHYVDSDFDDKPAKKTYTNRGKKQAAEAAAAEHTTYGLGISHAPPQPSKRRKTEKIAASVPMERSLSGAVNNTAVARGSPRSTPAPESKKRARAAPGPAPAKKRNQPIGAQSPQMVSSPVIGHFANNSTNTQRPQSSRARQNSTASINPLPQDIPRNRPPSSASNRGINGSTTAPEPAPVVTPLVPPNVLATPRSTTDPSTFANGAPSIEPPTMKREDPELPEGAATPTQQTIITRAGRASKTATPLAGTFPTADVVPMARSRSTRNGAGNSHPPPDIPVASGLSQPPKRSHKKGAAALREGNGNVGDEGSSMAGDEEGPEDVDEEMADDDDDADQNQERYCYCGGVSYGGMIGCDNPDCKRQWFHYACVGITKEPKKNAKWYCDECKENMKRSRPGSRA